MPAVCIDGMNVLEVHDAAREAVARARRGGGPTFIEAKCYRYRAHGGAGDDSRTGYREIAEREAWEERCPIRTYADFLADEGLIDEPRMNAMREDALAEMLDALAFAAASPNPTEADLYQHVYCRLSAAAKGDGDPMPWMKGSKFPLSYTTRRIPRPGAFSLFHGRFWKR